jgi:Transglutaminase-like superfamily
MTSMLIQREVLVPRVTPEFATAPQKPSDIWMGIYTPTAEGAEQRIGYVHTTSMPYTFEGIEGEGTRYSLTLKLAAPVLSYPVEVLLKGNSRVSRQNGLQDFNFTLQSFDEHVIRAEGKAAGDSLQVAIHTAGESFPMEIPMDPNLMISGGMGTTTLNVPSLEIGDEAYVSAFDPLTFTYDQNVRIACVDTGSFEFNGDLIPVKILAITAGGITNTVWVTLDNEIVRVETPVGFVLRRITQSEAMAKLNPAEMGEMLDTVAIHPAGLTPFRGAKRMRIRLSGMPPGAAPPSDSIQQETGDADFIIAPPEVPDPKGPLLDIPGPFLLGDAFVQADHPRIADQAEALTANLTDDWTKAQAIYQWVYENISKIIVMSFPSALEVLQTREGDCNEHTVLYTALARAAGIPTKMAIGIVWSDDLNGFYYHAWPEVYIGRWIPVDPTLGQPIADATHIKLLEGGIDSWPQLAGYLGQLRVEVLEIE